MRLRIAVVLLAMSAAAAAQSSNGYLFFGAGGILSTDSKNGSFGHIGAGADILAVKRLGVNAEIGGQYGSVYEGAGYLSVAPGVSYHFLPGKERKIDLFVTGGYTLLRNSQVQGNLFYAGAGLIRWGSGRAGLRVEFRDQVGSTTDFLHTAPSGAMHFLEFRVGLALR